MKLRKLDITNVAGIASASIKFTEPLTLFWGRNNAGKSSVRNALEWALTGRARGIRLKKDQLPMLGHAGTSPEVELHYDDGGIIRRTAKLDPPDMIGEMAAYVLDASAFVALPAKQRAAVIASIATTGDDLAKQALKECVGPIDSRLQRRIAGVDPYDIDGLRSAVVDIRRDAKRQIKAGQSARPELADYQLPGDYDPKAAKQVESDLRAMLAKAGAAKPGDEAQQLRSQLKAVRKEQAEQNALRMTVPTIDGDAAYADIAGAATSIIGDILNYIDSHGDTCACPVCGTESKADHYIKQLTAIQEQCQPLLDQRAKRNAVIAVNEKCDRVNADLERRAERLTTAIDAAMLVNDDEKQPDEVDTETIATSLTEVIGRQERYQRYCVDLHEHEAAVKQAEELKAVIAEADRVDALVKPGGAVEAYISEHGNPLPIPSGLAEIWGVDDMVWLDNGDITLHGRPIELASASEQYRVSAVMSIAIAALTGIGFCCLDGYEILVGDNANAMIRTAGECGIDQIIAFVASAKEPPANPPQGVEIYRVADGCVG